MSRRARFWIVWTPSCEKSPTIKHATFAEAKTAASCMANMNKQRYFVLQCVSSSGAEPEPAAEITA